MNAIDASTIPLTLILDRLGYSPIKTHSTTLHWYRSPFQKGNDALLKVDAISNRWEDESSGREGNAVDFAILWLKASGYDHLLPDAKRWLTNMGFMPPTMPETSLRSSPQISAKLKVKKTYSLRHKMLRDYLDVKGIPFALASHYLREVEVQNKVTGNSIFCVGFKNEDNGYEVFNQHLQTCIGSQQVTIFRGQSESTVVHVFEDIFDYLSIIAQNKTSFKNQEVIILNSLRCVGQSTAFLRNHTYQVAKTWLKNDAAGRIATDVFQEFFNAHTSIEHQAQNHLYAAYQSVNEWHLSQLK